MRLILFLLLAIASVGAAHAQDQGAVSAPRPLPALASEGHLTRGSARVWYATIGSGRPLVLLHGGMATSDSWGNQVPALLGAGYRLILIDTRGHGRSTLGHEPLSYERFADDVAAVLDTLHVTGADFLGWSDGANTALVLAMRRPQMMRRVVAFGANMDPAGAREDAFTAAILPAVLPILQGAHERVTPERGSFTTLQKALQALQAIEPRYTRDQLATIAGPRIAIVTGDRDEFIRLEHSRYLAEAIPGAALRVLPGAGHFAPWQEPEAFDRVVIEFLTQSP